jgi:hypothetical protein
MISALPELQNRNVDTISAKLQASALVQVRHLLFWIWDFMQ